MIHEDIEPPVRVFTSRLKELMLHSVEVKRVNHTFWQIAKCILSGVIVMKMVNSLSLPAVVCEYVCTCVRVRACVIFLTHFCKIHNCYRFQTERKYFIYVCFIIINNFKQALFITT